MPHAVRDANDANLGQGGLTMAIAQQIPALARLAMQPENSYRVVFDPQDGKAARLNWIAEENGHDTRHASEPAASGRRFEATIIDWFLPEELL